MLEGIVGLSLVLIFVLIIIYWTKFKCWHEWEIEKGTEQSNEKGWFQAYYILNRCKKCGKVSIRKLEV